MTFALCFVTAFLFSQGDLTPRVMELVDEARRAEGKGNPALDQLKSLGKEGVPGVLVLLREPSNRNQFDAMQVAVSI